MKVLVEFDLENSIHMDLFRKVQTVMQAHVQRIAFITPTPSEITKEELMEAYREASTADKAKAADLLAKLQVKYGEHLSEWSSDAKWMSHQQFMKLADSPAKFF